ncbi:MAG: hypothetical protein V8T01_07235 [Oscillospiraceae bacterium]
MKTFNAKAAEPVHHYATMHFGEEKNKKKTQNPELPKGLSFGEYLKLGTKDAKEYLSAIGNLPRTIFDKTIDTVDNAEKGVADLGKQVTGKWDSSDIQRWAAEKEAPAQPDDKETGKGMLWKGVTQAANGFAQTLGWLPGNALKELGWENNPFSNLAEAQQQIADAAQEYYGKNMQNGTKGQKIADEIGTSTVAALPQAIMAMMTMGGSAEAQLATGGARAAATLPGIAGNAKTSAVTAQQMAQTMAKNPNFWLAFSQVAGRNYQDAKADGASDWEANAFAMANGLVNAAVEVAGGIQKLPGELQVSESALKSWIKSAAEEGQEEVVQGVLERALQNLTYNKGNKVFSTKDEDAVLNPATGAKEFGLGMTVGGILGGGQTIVGKAAGLARGAAGNVQTDVRELQKAQTAEENTQEANNSAKAAQVTEVRELPAEQTSVETQTAEARELPMGQVSAESQVRELLGGEVTNSKAERILANAELRTAFETVTGETLAGTKAQQRETIKRAAESQNTQILQQNAQIQQVHSQNQAEIVNEPVASTANAQESGNFADVRGLPTAETQAKESARTAAEGYAREHGLLTGENTSGSAVEENARVMREAQENEAKRQELRDNPVEPGTHAEKMGVKISHPFAPITNVDDLVTEAKYAKKASRDIEKKIRELNPTPAEKEFAQGIAKGASFDSAGNIVGGTYTAEQIPTTMSKEKVTQLAYYYMAKNDYAGKLIRSRKYAAQRQWQGKLEELFGTSDDRKLPGALSLQVNTMQRNVEKTFGKELGKKINEEFFDPILENSAEKIRFINRMFDRVRGFDLSESESALVQRVIEGTAVADQVSKLDPDMQKRVTDAATSTDVKKTAAEMNIPQEQMELVEQYKAWLDTQARLQDTDVDAKKIEEAAEEYKKAYNEFYDLINEFLVSHGYDPIGYVKGYAPHMQPEKAQEGTAKFLKLIGINAQVSELPTAIAGRTDSFRPGKQWNPYFLERTKTSNDNVEYDAVGGYESYVNYMANVLYHTDDIMKLREMSKYFRGKYARDGISDRIAQAREMHNASLEQKIGFLESADRIADGTRLTEEQADAALDKYIDSLFENINGMTKYGQFVSVLDDYTNKLAGKQTKVDRVFEDKFGRNFLNLGNKLSAIFGQSTIVGNLSSALNQTAQIPMLTAEVGVGNVAEAVRDIVTGETKADGWEGTSDFLTGKRGIDQLTETKGLGKVMDVAAIPFEVVDDVASRVIVRAKYLQEVKSGATYEEAMRAADEYASRMVGNRIQGAKPMAFEDKNIFSKALTTFQLEVANAWSHISHDLPMEFQTMAKTQGKNVAVKKFAGLAMKYLLEAFLFNRLTEWIYGGTPAPFDVIGYVTGAIGAGEGLSTNKYLLTALDNTLESVTGERGLGTEKPDGGFDTEAAAKQLGYTASGDIPFLSNALSAVGASDSNMPLPTIPLKTGADVAKMVVGKDADTRKDAAQKLAEDAPKELKTWLPMGNQIYKTGKGVEALVRGGAYSGYGDSERLKYPVDTSGPKGLLKGAQMVLFGPNATQDANEFYASGDRSLTVKQTQAYRDIVASGADKKTVYETMQAVRSVDDDDPGAAAKAKRDAIRNADLPDRYKQQIYSAMIGDGKDVKFSALRSEKMSWDSIMDCYDVYDRINRDDEKASIKAVEFAAEVDRMKLSDAQKAAVKSNLVFYSGVQAKAETYEKITGAGVSTSEAETLARTIGALTPEEGADSVTAMQKYKAIVDSGVSDATAAAAVQAIMPDSIAVKFSAVRQWNVPAEKYVEVYEATEGIKEKYGKTSLNAGMAKAAIDSVSGLTQEQRAALWQIQNKSWKPYKNPYSTSVGSSVRARLESGTVTNSLPTGTSRPAGALWLPK